MATERSYSSTAADEKAKRGGQKMAAKYGSLPERLGHRRNLHTFYTVIAGFYLYM